MAPVQIRWCVLQNGILNGYNWGAPRAISHRNPLGLSESESYLPAAETPAALALTALSGVGWSSDSLWPVAPSIETSLAAAQNVSDSPGGWSRTIRRGVRDLAASTRRSRVAGALVISDVAFAWDTENQARVIRPMVGVFKQMTGTGAQEYGWPFSYVLGSNASESGYLERGGTFPDSHTQAFADGRSLDRLARRAEVSKTLAERVLDSQPHCLVVASQQSVLARGFSLHFRRAGVPTVYFPHAPFADRPWYYDMPFHYAGLRGARAVQHVSSLLQDPSRVSAVGTTNLQPIDDLASLNSAVVLALSPLSDADLAKIVEIVEGAGVEPVIAPHPRQRLTSLRRLLPSRWAITDQMTTDALLGTGPGVLIQAGSGVGLEALRRGIPLVDLRLGSGEPPYLYLRSEAVMVATDSESLATHVEYALSSGRDLAYRSDLARIAYEWSGPSGTEAVTAFVKLIEDARVAPESTLPPLLLDRWASFNTQ